MRSRLAELLVCPKCSASLQLEIQGRDNEEILAGRLHCSKCRSEFPIRDGIPRFAPSSAYVESFSFEWKRWQRTQFDTESRKLSESTFVVCTGRRPQQLAAKLVLNVGCGTGRFMDVLARAGAEIVGLDLSLAVEVARQNLRSLPNCHFIQADALCSAVSPRHVRFRLQHRRTASHVQAPTGFLAHGRDVKAAGRGGHLGLPPLPSDRDVPILP